MQKACMVNKEELEKFKRPLYSEEGAVGLEERRMADMPIGRIFDVVKTCKMEARSRRQCE